MDVTLVTASAGVAMLIPSPHFRSDDSMRSPEKTPAVGSADGGDRRRAAANDPAVRLALLLSLCLLTQSVLEVAPVSWLWFFDDSGDLAAMFRSILWVDCAFLGLVVPAGAGASLFSKARVQRRMRRLLRPLYFLYKSVSMLLNIALALVGLVLSRVLIRYRSRTTELLPRVDSFAHQGAKGKVVKAQSSAVDTRTSSAVRRMGTGWRHLSFRPLGCTIAGMLFGVLCSWSVLKVAGSFVIVGDDQETGNVSLLRFVVSHLCAVGIVISSALNGFGCVSMPHSCLVGSFLRPISADSVAKMDEEYRFLSKSLEEKRLALNDAIHHQKVAVPIVSGPSASIQSFRECCKPRGSVRSREDATLQTLQNEVNFLENLIDEFRDEMEEMRRSRRLAADARLPFGRIRGWVGVMFSVILLIRVALATITIARQVNRGSSSRSDPITSLLVWLTGHHIVKQEQYDSLSQGISLLLAGFLSLSQVRMFLRTASALNRRLGRWFNTRECRVEGIISHGVHASELDHSAFDSNSGLLSYLTASLMGCYFLACVVLMRMNLPMKYRSSFSSAFGGELNINIVSVNVVFSMSAFVSAVTLGLLFGIQRQNAKRHQFSTEINVDGSTRVGVC